MKLRTDPFFDPTNPLILKQVITGEESDTVTFQVPINFHILTNVADIQLRLDGGTGPEVQDCKENAADGTTLLGWKTTFTPPGHHYLQAKLCLTVFDFNTGSPITTAVGNPVLFQTQNAIQFDSFYSYFDNNGATLYALTFPGTAYSIELSDANGAHLRTFTGTVSADATEINQFWDLTDDNNNAYIGDSFTAAFTITPPSSSGPETHSIKPSKVSLAFGEGDFTIAYSYRITALCGRGNALNQCIQNGAVEPLISPNGQNPYPNTFNSYIWPNNTLGDPGYIDSKDRVDSLLANLSKTPGNSGNYTRDFYYYGIGSAHLLAGAPNVQIKSAIVAGNLGNTDGGGCGGTKINHPYRFVFLDACHSGDDEAWAKAFGMPPKLTTYAEVSQHSDRAQAFLGWQGEIVSIGTPDACGWYQYTLQSFFQLWQSKIPLTNCVQICANKTALLKYIHDSIDYSFPAEYIIPLGAPQEYKSRGGRALGSATTIYGYPWIKRDGISSPQ